MNEFNWRLRALMHEHGLEETSKLRPLLGARGVRLSREQVFRLVTYPPERLSMETLVALCDIFNCTPDDLIDVRSPLRTPVLTRKKRRTKGPGITTTRVRLH